MKLTLTVDRFEGDDKSIAVLTDDDGEYSINWPKSLLPKGTKAGDILSFQIDRDTATTKRVTRQTKAVQHELKTTDPGGDVK